MMRKKLSMSLVMGFRESFTYAGLFVLLFVWVFSSVGLISVFCGSFSSFLWFSAEFSLCGFSSFLNNSLG